MRLPGTGASALTPSRPLDNPQLLEDVTSEFADDSVREKALLHRLVKSDLKVPWWNDKTSFETSTACAAVVLLGW